MDLRHYDSNGLELSSVLLFEVGLISIVIKIQATARFYVENIDPLSQYTVRCYLTFLVLYILYFLVDWVYFISTLSQLISPRCLSWLVDKTVYHLSPCPPMRHGHHFIVVLMLFCPFDYL